MSLIEDLNWRHACKAYDPTKKVSQDDLNKIVEAARLAPTSSGLQPFKVIVLKDSELRDQIAPTALNADCVRECSHILVFAAWDRYTAERIDTVYDLTTDVRDLPRGRFVNYTDKLKEMYLDEAADANFAHIARQTYIALGLALAQAAELKIDSTPAEGFDNAAVDRVLGLQELGLKSVSLMYIGYADKERDWLAPMKKVRQPLEEFVVEM
ncbi:nitroreductase family protein [Sphingobacterium corticibacter]|uniref:NAD(P)H-dependent oxidoreductase n=1 Tax=Sphingobacterium corticibacter TaxID=2171749 RepID=A0A2T8HKL9_9SPHI|nr:nitroreductase family protein [Sphingobacterium corticibacter]PVH25994.1 NAD(P)H-dependent oxidoreductase [Sphingobacterium corticibacter]